MSDNKYVGKHAKTSSNSVDEHKAERRERSTYAVSKKVKKEAESVADETPKKKKKHLALIIVGAILLVIILAVVILFSKLYGSMNIVKSGTAATPTPETVAAETVSTPEPTPTEKPLSEEEIAEIDRQKLEAELSNAATELAYSDDVYNILLIGCDSRPEEGEGRSDTTLLISINKATQEIWLTSFQRDSYVNIPGWGNSKMNAAYTYGGTDLVKETIESNFGVAINNYALVNFEQFVAAVAAIGSITVEMTPEEVDALNYSLPETNRLVHLREDGSLNYNIISEEDRNNGTFTLDPAQTLAYCRIRNVDTTNGAVAGDTGRSMRQRNALTLMWENVKQMSLREMYDVLQTIMDSVTTDMTAGQCASLLLNAASYMKYDMNTQQIPVVGAYFGTMIDELSCYSIDFTNTRKYIQATIYGVESEAIYSDWTGSLQCIWEPEEE